MSPQSFELNSQLPKITPDGVGGQAQRSEPERSDGERSGAWPPTQASPPARPLSSPTGPDELAGQASFPEAAAGGEQVSASAEGEAMDDWRPPLAGRPCAGRRRGRQLVKKE